MTKVKKFGKKIGEILRERSPKESKERSYSLGLLRKGRKFKNDVPSYTSNKRARFRTFTTELVTNYLILYIFNLNKVSNCIFILKGIGV